MTSDLLLDEAVTSALYSHVVVENVGENMSFSPFCSMTAEYVKAVTYAATVSSGASLRSNVKGL